MEGTAIPSIQLKNSYDSRLRDETSRYESCLDVHSLPPIFHYWSERYVRPKLQAVGIEGPDAMFQDYLSRICAAPGGEPRTFLSIGSGNCDLEIEAAAFLRSHGHSDFVIECLELNGAMLERGEQAAAAASLTSHLRFTQADFNLWKAGRAYDAVIANQSLHHVLNLEGLLDQVRQALAPDSLFLISDMIGRNGHQRWPEALAIVGEFWRRLPPSYRHNQSLDRYEEMYENWDCAKESFEGIRAQDVLPLLLDRFHPHVFVAFGNVIDVFTDRAFGFHFNAESEWDRQFIDAVQDRDEAEMRAGGLTPTHLIAVFGHHAVACPQWNLEPRKCVRDAAALAEVPASDGSAGPYEWHSWPHGAETQLETVCTYLSRLGPLQSRVATLEVDLEERTEWARRLEARADERTEWAVRLDEELKFRTEWAIKIKCELEQSGATIRGLQKELNERTEWARSLERETTERTAWAQQLDEQLNERTEWALRLQRELEAERLSRRTLAAELRSPGRVVMRLARVIRDRLRRLR